VLSRGTAADATAAAADADEAIVRRLVDAAIFPELLARETATALMETLEAESVVVFVARRPETSECWQHRHRHGAGLAIARAASQGTREHRGNPI
jgi:hypothetical protein